ncbi:MAG: hypothetical protein FWE54_07280, partial [Methanimicrococcus sp.]|nr:hypothetical protein [Methanimicrococcus sp.]
CFLTIHSFDIPVNLVTAIYKFYLFCLKTPPKFTETSGHTSVRKKLLTSLLEMNVKINVKVLKDTRQKRNRLNFFTSD